MPNNFAKPEAHEPVLGLFPEKVSFIRIDETGHDQRLDNFLQKICKGVPKSHLYRIIRNGEVRVNRTKAKAETKLISGDLLRIPPLRMSKTEEKPNYTPAQEFPILFEDDALLIINKPAGVAVHGGSGVNFGIIEQLRKSRPQAKFLELVHRLDRETSGVLMIAKKRSALTQLHEQIRNHELDKRYYAMVKGKWLNATQHLKQSLHKYLTPEGERRVMVKNDGQPSHTIIHLQSHWLMPDGTFASEVEAELKTGRTHQIRVHLAHAHFPIIGDEKYGDFTLNKQLSKIPAARGMFLHAHALRVQHPITREHLHIEAPRPENWFDWLTPAATAQKTSVEENNPS